MTGAHKDWVSSLDFLRPQNVLLSGCRGGMLKLWRVENGAPVCKLTEDWCFENTRFLFSYTKLLRSSNCSLGILSYLEKWTMSTAIPVF